MSHHWGYCQANGPETWHAAYPEAQGVLQSPIDIKAVDLKTFRSSKKLEWRYSPQHCTDLTNTGHSWQVGVEQGGSALSGGPLQGTYELAQLHSHWGTTDDDGSEHSIDGKKFAAELHFVHWNSSKYPTVEEAAKYPDGYCVLGVFLKPGAKNEELEKIVVHLPEIEHKNDTTPLATPVDPTKLLPKDASCGYYTYQGSLTTPPCSECVIWIVFKEPLEASPDQLKLFRSLKYHPKEQSCPCKHHACEGLITTNFRPTYPLGSREVLEGR